MIFTNNDNPHADNKTLQVCLCLYSSVKHSYNILLWFINFWQSLVTLHWSLKSHSFCSLTRSDEEDWQWLGPIYSVWNRSFVTCETRKSNLWFVDWPKKLNIIHNCEMILNLLTKDFSVICFVVVYNWKT